MPIELIMSKLPLKLATKMKKCLVIDKLTKKLIILKTITLHILL